MKLLTILASMLLSVTTSATPYRMESVTLMQPDVLLKERVPSFHSLSEYIRAVHGAAEAALAGAHPSPASGYLVLAVRPGGQSMVWLDFKPSLPEKTATELRAAILAVPVFEARGGVVVFALSSSLWGFPVSKNIPNPPEWRKAMEGRSETTEIGELVERVWPAGEGTDSSFKPAPLRDAA